MQNPPGRTMRLLAVAGLLLLIALSAVWIATIWSAPPRDVARQARLETRREARTPPLESFIADRGGVTELPPPITETPTCERCHGELELLRQHTESVAEARTLLVPFSDVQPSAHGHLTCAECHTDFRTFPHPQSAVTQTCADCHAEEHQGWQSGAHAGTQGDVAECSSCHTVHQVESVQTLLAAAGMDAMNARCVSCHRDAELPAHNPHVQEVPCSGCHEPHDTGSPDDPQSELGPQHVAATCGACHVEALDAWREDVHGNAELAAATRAHDQRTDATGDGVPATCIDCHGGHDMYAPADTGFVTASVQACGTCHETAMDTWAASYHGQATELGSAVSATCSDCHGAHRVYPEEHPRSLVHEANLIDTCSQCHQYAREQFVAYDSHPDPFNPDRNLWITASFFFMNGLLVFVLIVFGAHTLLWWRKIEKEKKEGHGHGSDAHGEGRGR